MPAPGSLRVRAQSRLGRHQAAWDALGTRQPIPTPFQRSWWLEGVGPTDTTYLLVLDDDRLVGGIALREARLAGVRRLVAPGPLVLCPDHLDLMAQPGAEGEVVAAVAHWLGRPGQRLLDVRGLVADSLLARAAGTAAAPADVAPYEPLPAPPEDFLSGRSSNFRRSVRRSTRRLAGLGFEHRRVTAEGLPEAVASFRSLQDDRDGRGPLVAALPTLARALTAGVAAGEARVDVLASDDEVIAASFAFVVAGRLSLYQVARSLEAEHDGAGTALLAAVIEDAVAAGCVEVDLLRGGEGYKSSFADATRQVMRLRAARGGVARAQLSAEDAARRVSARLRSRVP
ncbi:GNAT family N-acetyltransferase [Nocardioides sp. URHA0020]|uniref:GNAT family N-acetyltransferase n=1 Tax=Nocardioides sp. URHA0020 TaxID=1380392 RepID=UPI0004917D8E|nr:GNAT family N-acetyltransferase [Nocardioides sp. URHA0020]